MKKRIAVAASVVSLSAILLTLVSITCDHGLIENDVEALSYCEITNKKGEVVLVCSGENTCSAKAMGYTLTCDGTLH